MQKITLEQTLNSLQIEAQQTLCEATHALAEITQALASSQKHIQQEWREHHHQEACPQCSIYQNPSLESQLYQKVLAMIAATEHFLRYENSDAPPVIQEIITTNEELKKIVRREK